MNPPIAVPSTKYYPAIDGLRAVAVTLVFLLHYAENIPYLNDVAGWGWVGVDIFFVLSGFLITGILFDTQGRANYFGSFYLRRALRIFPLFYGVWALILIVGLFGHPLYHRYNLAMAFYLGNLFEATHPESQFVRILFHGHGLMLGVGHFWTLAVEEQFYLIWPVCIWLIRDRIRLGRVCVAISVAVVVLRCLLLFRNPGAVEPAFVYNQIYTRADALLIGAWLSLWIRDPAVTQAKMRRAGTWLLAAFTASFLVGELVAVHTVRFLDIGTYISSIGFTLVDLAAAGLLLLTISPETIVFRVLRLKPLVSFGRISYGFYVFHAIPAYVMFGLWQRLEPHHIGFLEPIFAFVSVYAISYLSYRFWEAPFLRLKDRLSVSSTTPPHPAGEPIPSTP